jgi:hypothetical protein
MAVRMKTLQRFLPLCLAASLAVPRAFAQQPPAPPPPRPSPVQVYEANKHAAIGTKLFNEGLYEAAIPELEKAYEVLRRPQDIEKIAQAHEKIGQWPITTPSRPQRSRNRWKTWPKRSVRYR